MFLTLSVVIALFILIRVTASYYVKVPPNIAVILSRCKHTFVRQGGRVYTRCLRVVYGGGLRRPIHEQFDHLSLKVMTIDVETAEVYTVKGAAMIVDDVVQIKVAATKHPSLPPAGSFWARAFAKFKTLSYKH